MSNISFPSLTRTIKLKVTSTVLNTKLPRNYHSNLTYSCGDARLFKVVLKQNKFMIYIFRTVTFTLKHTQYLASGTGAGMPPQHCPPVTGWPVSSPPSHQRAHT